MSVTQKDINRVAELYKEIEGRKEHEHAAPTYRDRKDLLEMEEILSRMTETDEKSLQNKKALTAYLARAYDEMFRMAISCRFYSKLMKIHAKLNSEKPYDEDTYYKFRCDLTSAVKARNMYNSDDCSDYADILAASFGDGVKDFIKQTKKKCAPHLKHDPVELSDQYLAVIDDVEKEVDEKLGDTPRGMGICHLIWELKTEALRNRGIQWRSPRLMNPRVMFD